MRQIFGAEIAFVIQTTNWIVYGWRHVQPKVGEEWIGSGNRLVRGTYRLKFYHSWTSCQCGINTCQDTCRQRRNEDNEPSQGKFCEIGFLVVIRWFLWMH